MPADSQPAKSERTPAADFVGHPAMDAGSYRVVYQGIYRRPGLDGVWAKRMELWRESAEQCGAWRWVHNDDIPLGAERTP